MPNLRIIHPIRKCLRAVQEQGENVENTGVLGGNKMKQREREREKGEERERETLRKATVKTS